MNCVEELKIYRLRIQFIEIFVKVMKIFIINNLKLKGKT